MLIVDSQIHIWENAKMSAHHRQIPTYSEDDALKEMAAAGVDAAVLHPPSTLCEAMNALAVEAVKHHPDKSCILGNFDLQAPNREEIVRNWRARPGMLGFRFTFNQPHQKAWWTDGSLNWFWDACEKQGYPVGLLAGGYMQAFGKIAESHPGLKIHIDHLGRHGGGAGGTDDAAWADLPEMLALAKLPNVAVKMSGAPSYSSAPVQEHPRLSEADLRRLRTRALLLGDRHHPHAVQLPAMRDDVHRGAALVEGPRPRAGHGPRGMRVARLEAPGAGPRLRCIRNESISWGGARHGGAYYDGGTSTGGRQIMTKHTLLGGTMALAMLMGLSACTDPYDPAQRAVGGGLLGAATGAAIGAAAGGGRGAALGAAIGGGVGAATGVATTPRPPPPPPGYYGGYPPPPPPGYYGGPPPYGY